MTELDGFKKALIGSIIGHFLLAVLLVVGPWKPLSQDKAPVTTMVYAELVGPKSVAPERHLNAGRNTPPKPVAEKPPEKPVSKPVPKPVAEKPPEKPVSKPAPKPVAEKPPEKPVSKPAPKPEPVPKAEPMVKKSPPEPVKKPEKPVVKKPQPKPEPRVADKKPAPAKPAPGPEPVAKKAVPEKNQVDTGIPQGGTVADELGAEALASYEDYFRQRVSDMWRRSLSAREGMRVRMEVRLSRSGDVLDVRVLDSSGDLAFDRSCEQAIHKAAPFEKLASVDPKTFNKHFRKRILEFSPEDLF